MSRPRSGRWLWFLSLGLLLSLLLGRSVLYTVNEREMAVIVQFGEVVHGRREPGLYFKLPLIQEVRRLPNTLQFSRGMGPQDKLVDVPTSDGFKIEVSVWAAWKITDPELFVRTLRTVDEAETRVLQFVRGEARDEITKYSLAELVRSTDRKLVDSYAMEAIERSPDNQKHAMAPGAVERIKLGREKLVAQLKASARRKLGPSSKSGQEGRGIELIDVGISRIDFVPDVRDKAFSRQIAVMETIAAKYVSEGDFKKQEILNRTQAEIQTLQGEGAKEASIIRGQVDAQIIDAYAKAISETGDFYRFVRTLEAYETVFGGKTRLILTTDSDLFRLLKESSATATGSEAVTKKTATEDQPAAASAASP